MSELDYQCTNVKSIFVLMCR